MHAGTVVVAAVAALLGGAGAFLPAQNPPWAPTYNMSQSTITMACNSSGWFNASLAAQFGVVTFDWSNAKAQWANAKPMDCQERLITQAERTKALNPAAHVGVYRNLVKALPWFTNVREKLDDPAYSHWFLKFKPGGSLRNGSWHVPACTGSGAARKCSALYHDQEQTPEHPAGDGSCADWCDCGAQPCGEYLWDWREPSLLPWMVAEVTGAAALGNAAVDFLFIDDYWCAHLVNGSGACHDPVQGPSEIDAHSQADMGLSDADVAALTRGWLRAMTAVQQAVVDAGGYTWSLFPGQQNANASPTMVTPQSCAAALRAACSPRSAWQRQPLTYGLAPGNSTAPLPQLEQDMAAFLLMRGPYAYVGWGVWGMSWPVGVSWNSHGTPVARPPMLDADYGSPLSTCVESSPGVFTRAYTKAAVALDCNKWQGNITMQQR